MKIEWNNVITKMDESDVRHSATVQIWEKNLQDSLETKTISGSLRNFSLLFFNQVKKSFIDSFPSKGLKWMI